MMGEFIQQRSGDFVTGLLDLIRDLPDDIVMAEIGCYAGGSTMMFWDSGKVKTLYAIDTWRRKGHFIAAENHFDKVARGTNIVKMRGTIVDAIDKLPPLDFVYIDGNHSYEWVTRDIKNSLKILKPGAVIAGHDYAEQYTDRVVKAVDECLGKPDKIYIDTSWIKIL